MAKKTTTESQTESKAKSAVAKKSRKSEENSTQSNELSSQVSEAATDDVEGAAASLLPVTSETDVVEDVAANDDALSDQTQEGSIQTSQPAPQLADEVPNDAAPASEFAPAQPVDVAQNADPGKYENLLSLLKNVRLNAIQIYGVSQRFFSENLDIVSLVSSLEENLVVNTLDVLSRQNYWLPEVVKRLCDQNEVIRAEARRYVLGFVAFSGNAAQTIVNAVCALRPDHEDENDFQDFIGRILSAFLVRISHEDENVKDWLAPFTQFLQCVDKRQVDRMVYDSSALVRIGVLRYIKTLESIELNTLASSLILLKDNNEDVNEAVLRMVARFACYPELAVSPLIAYVAKNGKHAQLVFDAFRRFSDDAFSPLLAALGEQSDDTANAVRQIILASPQRYVEPLKEAYNSSRTRPPAKSRIADILLAISKLVDPPLNTEILVFLRPPAPPQLPDLETPARPKTEFIQPVLDKDDRFYHEVIADDELSAYDALDNDAILRLLNDSRDFPRLNALHLVRVAHKNSPEFKSNVFVWLKSMHEQIAKSAFDTYLTFFNGEELELTHNLVSVIGTCENRKLAAYFFEFIASNQKHINNIFEMYRQDPPRYQSLVLRLLKNEPSSATIKLVAKCLDIDASPSCIATTLQLLFSNKNSLKFDFEPYRKRILQIIENPPSKGEYAIVIRRNSLRILNNLVQEGDHDKESRDILHAAYKKFYYADFKKLASDILKKMDEDNFEDLDDEDDFDDLDD